MKRLIDFNMDDGGKLVVEVEDVMFSSGAMRGGLSSDIMVKAEQTFESALARIKPAVRAIAASIHDVYHPADEVEVTFGIKLSAEAGAIITSTSTEANFEVKLKWKCLPDPAPRQ
jgi:hypothetical protein